MGLVIVASTYSDFQKYFYSSVNTLLYLTYNIYWAILDMHMTF